MLRFLGSLKLTLALLLLLAIVSIAGTLQPMAEGRYDLFYQSPWFRLLLALLAVNLGVCTLTTIRRNLADRDSLFDALQGEQLFAASQRFVLPNLDNAAHAATLRRFGYRVEEHHGALLARRGLAGRWGSTVVHLSVLGIMIGALAAEFGFVGTVNLHVGKQSSVYFDWKTQTDQPLGFEFRLDHFELLYYPIELKFAAVDPVTRQPIETFTATEGDEVTLAPDVRAKVLRFFPSEEKLVLGISRNGIYLGEYYAMGGRHVVPNSVDPGMELRPVAFRDPIVKQLRSEVSILEQGTVVHQGVIEVNTPLSYHGVKIYQTAYNQDQFGFWSAGFQFTRDPAEPLVWIGSILLVVGLLCAFAIPYRAVGLATHEGELLLVALAGFRGEDGTTRFVALGGALAESSRNPHPDDAVIES